MAWCRWRVIIQFGPGQTVWYLVCLVSLVYWLLARNPSYSEIAFAKPIQTRLVVKKFWIKKLAS
jgi:hypothetical protein